MFDVSLEVGSIVSIITQIVSLSVRDIIIIRQSFLSDSVILSDSLNRVSFQIV